jgi:hypothetical protein
MLGVIAMLLGLVHCAYSTRVLPSFLVPVRPSHASSPRLAGISQYEGRKRAAALRILTCASGGDDPGDVTQSTC